MHNIDIRHILAVFLPFVDPFLPYLAHFLHTIALASYICITYCLRSRDLQGTDDLRLMRKAGGSLRRGNPWQEEGSWQEEG